MDPIALFSEEVARNVRGIGEDKSFIALSNDWNQAAIKHHYAYNFSWLGRPIIQVPQDAYAIQELIWRIRPDLVIETGIAHGGSLVMSASMLALLDYCEAVVAGTTILPAASQRRVLGIDIEIRAHNRHAIDVHPMRHLIEMIEGSSIDPDVVQRVHQRAADFKTARAFLIFSTTRTTMCSRSLTHTPRWSQAAVTAWCGIRGLKIGRKDSSRPSRARNNPKSADIRVSTAASGETACRRRRCGAEHGNRQADRAQTRHHGCPGRISETGVTAWRPDRSGCSPSPSCRSNSVMAV